MKIDIELISKLEKLARLELSQQEKGKLIGDLNAILEMVEKLEQIETSDVEPLSYITKTVNALRDDVVDNQIATKEALKNAPDKDDQYFKVPKVIDIK